MKGFIILLVSLFLPAGCASTGRGSADTPLVQVFPSAEEVQCEYEVIQTVRATWTTSAREPNYQRIWRERLTRLGIAGGRVGADGVILPPHESEVRRVLTGERFLFRWEGEAIKCIRG